MYEYKYRRIETGGSIWSGNSDAVHRIVIDEEAQNGWRFVGYVPTEFTAKGGMSAIDLIFERPTEK